MTDTVEITPVAETTTTKPTDKMDMALDDIVKTMKKPRRGGKGGKGNNKANRGAGQLNQGGKKKKGGKGVNVPQSLKTSGPPKLSISNLNFKVSDSDLAELFSEFGNIKSAAVHYNSSGKSLGTAHVVYMNKDQAVKAAQQYNGVHLDGRPMRISMEGGIITGTGKKGKLVKRLGKGQQGGKGKGGNKGRGGKKREKAEPKTAEELDAEMDAYLNSKDTEGEAEK